MTHLIQLHQWLVVSSRSLAIVLLSVSVTVACGGAEPMVQEDPNEGLTADLVQRMLPNPTGEVITQWAALPDERSWGSTAGIDIGPDGHIWVYDRCGANGLDGGCEANPGVDPDSQVRPEHRRAAGQFRRRALRPAARTARRRRWQRLGHRFTGQRGWDQGAPSDQGQS